jgi:hypothetical protein
VYYNMGWHRGPTLLRSRSSLEVITFVMISSGMRPSVGISMLFCNHVKVLETGLLTSSSNDFLCQTPDLSARLRGGENVSAQRSRFRELLNAPFSDVSSQDISSRKLGDIVFIDQLGRKSALARTRFSKLQWGVVEKTSTL